MNFFSRAIISVIRKPKKGILFLLVLFSLGILLSSSISIQSAINSTEENLRARMPPVTSLTWDHQMAYANDGIPRDFLNWERPSREMISQVGNLPYVKNYDFWFHDSLLSRDLEWAYVPFNENQLPEGVKLSHAKNAAGGFRHLGGELEIFHVKGIHNPDIIDIQAGLISLDSGRVFTEEEINHGKKVAVISRSLADTNNLKVGSTFLLENSVHDNIKMHEEGAFLPSDKFLVANQIVELKIIGIFEVEKEFIYSDERSFFEAIGNRNRLYNQIYIPLYLSESLFRFRNEFLSEMKYSYGIHEEDFLRFFGGVGMVSVEDLLSVNTMFHLYDSRDSNAFIQTAAEILPEFWEVRDLSLIFRKISSAMDTIQWSINLIFYITTSAIIIITTLLILLFLHDRKLEMGIYRALGETKTKIIFQVLVEILPISIVAITISLFAGNSVANLLSNHMINQDLIRQEEAFNDNILWEFEIPWELTTFNPGSMSIEEMMDVYDVSLDVTTIITFSGLGLLLVIISTVVPIFYILRLDTKKILM